MVKRGWPCAPRAQSGTGVGHGAGQQGTTVQLVGGYDCLGAQPYLLEQPREGHMEAETRSWKEPAQGNLFCLVEAEHRCCVHQAEGSRVWLVRREKARPRQTFWPLSLWFSVGPFALLLGQMQKTGAWLCPVTLLKRQVASVVDP